MLMMIPIVRSHVVGDDVGTTADDDDDANDDDDDDDDDGYDNALNDLTVGILL